MGLSSASQKPAATQAAMKFDSLGPGSVILFSPQCPLPQLSGKRATLVQVRTYRFGDDIQISYVLQIDGKTAYGLTVAEDSEGYYLALSRELSADEQDAWFGRDALSFFTEPSTARTIRCKANLELEGEWAAPRYMKSVDWIEGSVLLGRMSPAQMGRQVRQFHYNLLVNDAADRALEIEHEDATGENRVLVTVYRPIEDIASLAAPSPQPAPAAKPAMAQTPPATNGVAQKFEEPPLFAPPTPTPAAAAPSRNDFRRMNAVPLEAIHVAREEHRPQPAMDAILAADLPPLPSFLTTRENNYLSLDTVIPPETDRVRTDLRSAKVMIDLALSRGVRVRDIMREMLGLDSMLADEVIFELPLSDADYRQLAMRYRLRPDHRDEIRKRLEEELSQRLIGIAKR